MSTGQEYVRTIKYCHKTIHLPNLVPCIRISSKNKFKSYLYPIQLSSIRYTFLIFVPCIRTSSKNTFFKSYLYAIQLSSNCLCARTRIVMHCTNPTFLFSVTCRLVFVFSICAFIVKRFRPSFQRTRVLSKSSCFIV